MAGNGSPVHWWVVCGFKLRLYYIWEELGMGSLLASHSREIIYTVLNS